MKSSKLKTVEQFKNDCLSVIKSYQSDLDYDLEIISGENSAIFFAYDCGSHAIVLKDFEEYPPAGMQVKYLFGTADRQHILNETGATLECECVRNAPLVHYYDAAASTLSGRKVIREITHDKAKQIVTSYKTDMTRQFRRHNGIKAA